MVLRIFQNFKKSQEYSTSVRHCLNYCLKLVYSSIRSHCIPFNDTSFQQSLRFKKIIQLPLELEVNGNPLQYSCLENPRDGGAWWAAVYGVAQSRTRLKRLSSTSPLNKVRVRGMAPQCSRSQIITLQAALCVHGSISMYSTNHGLCSTVAHIW